MPDHDNVQRELGLLADRLAGRRDDILQKWRTAIDDDPLLTTGSALMRRQLDDHIPALLESFENHLRAAISRAEPVAHRAEVLKAAQHGLQRWQQGFRLIEVVREWRHLQLALQDEVSAQLSDLSTATGEVARRQLTILCIDGLSESAERYEAMEQGEAQNRLSELESALAAYENIERQRADAWREAAHDLRGNLGVVKTATALLNSGGTTDSARTKSLDILHRGVESMHELLNELISLARLEAGREVRKLRAFDVADVCAQLCESMHQMAEGRGLELSYEGPKACEVEGDPMKVRRIAQNLLVNALTYTNRGKVIVAVSAVSEASWVLRVEDTGPGVPAAVAGAMLDEPDAPRAVILNGPGAPAAANGPTHLRSSRPGGEGIGLSIVKRLCDLLEATLQLAPRPGGGSIFTVTFPRKYKS